jgi:putative phage-type endonuclease
MSTGDVTTGDMSTGDMTTSVMSTSDAATSDMSTSDKLEDWINRNNIHIVQHSPEWHAARSYSVGGSSIATIMGLNPFEDMTSFVNTRVGVSSFNGSLATEWGTMFEPIITRYVEKIYKCTVKCDQFFVRRGNLSYSPDGIAVIADNIVLLEFKCPYNRIPAPEPPAYYIPQVKMGLAMIDITTCGYFIEGVYRKCKWEDMGTNGVYELFDGQKKALGNTALDCNFVGFYISESSYRSSQFMDKFIYHFGSMSRMGDVHDLSDMPKDIFEEMLMMIRTDTCRQYYPMTKNYEEELVAFSNIPGILIGVLPWKLMSIQTTIIDKTPDYLDPYLETIDNLCQCIREYNDPENELKKYNILDTFYESVGLGFTG